MSKIPKKSKKKTFFFSKKNLKNFKEKKCFEKCLQKKNRYQLSFPILGGRDPTGALQSSPFQISGGLVLVSKSNPTTVSTSVTKNGRTNEGNPRV